MPVLDRPRCTLVMIDFQARLMPAIDRGAEVLAAARRLRAAADLLEIPVLFTEQNPAGLGPTATELETSRSVVFAKNSFDAGRKAGFLALLPPDRDLLVAGCEAHVCVLQTVLGLRPAGRHVFVAADATGSRRPEDRVAGLDRMARHGAEIVTSEMAIFEWLESADHPRFREVLRVVK